MTILTGKNLDAALQNLGNGTLGSAGELADEFQYLDSAPSRISQEEREAIFQANTKPENEEFSMAIVSTSSLGAASEKAIAASGEKIDNDLALEAMHDVFAGLDDIELPSSFGDMSKGGFDQGLGQ